MNAAIKIVVAAALVPVLVATAFLEMGLEDI